MKIQLFISILFSTIVLSCNGQDSEIKKQKIKWLKFEQAVEANKKEPKKMFIDVYTEWCGWCKKMDASTFVNDSVVQYMNEKFYAVKLDAEMKDSVVYNDHVFTYKPEYKANELAMSLLQGKMSYPTFLVMDEKVNMLSPIPGYKQADELMSILRYFGDNIYLNQSWTDYANGLKKP